MDYDDGYLSENFRYINADENHLYVRRVRLPDGKGNIIYLLSNTFENSLKMITSDNFIIPPTYKRIYYPWISRGSFMGRRYKLNITKEKNERNKLITSMTKLRPYATRTLNTSIENLFFSVADIYASLEPILFNMSVKRAYTEFFPGMISIMKGMTPEPTLDDKPGFNQRIIMIDVEQFFFKAGAPLKENKTNPLYLLYLAYLRNRNLSTSGIDIDFLICRKNMFMKFNPAHLTKDQFNTFKRCLFRLMNANLDEYTDSLPEEDKKEINITAKDTLTSNIISDTLSPYTQNLSISTKTTLVNAVENKIRNKAKEISKINSEIKAANIAKPKVELPEDDIFKKSLMATNPIKNPLTDKQEKLFKAMGYEPLSLKTGQLIDDDTDDEDEYPDEETVDDYEDDIKSATQEVLSEDEEVLSEVIDDMQENTAPLKNPKTSPINSARDAKLREAQKKVIIKNSTIEEIISKDAINVPIETDDRSSVMHTSNKNMYVGKFSNFDKTYINTLYNKDIVACFDMLKDKDSPFYITNIDVKDTSTSLDLKETWTVSLIDENNKKHTLKVDIPKFQNDRFMFINGTKWIILKQNFYNPLVKDTPDTVILTTNYQKITIQRKATKSLGSIERIFSLMKKTGDTKLFIAGDSSKPNMKYISSLEYDEISRRIFKFSSGNCELYFSRDYIASNLEDKIPNEIKGSEFFIGTEHGIPVLIDEDTGLDRNGRTIVDIIEQNLDDKNHAIFKSIKSPAQSMYTEAKLAGQFMPVVTILTMWIGLSKTLDKMGIRWKFDPDAKRMSQQNSATKYIRFADGILSYENKTFAELIMNGLGKMHPEKFQFSDFDTDVCYNDFIYSLFGSYKGINEVQTFYSFLIDPITKDVCYTLKLPDDPVGLIIYAVKLLADNAFVSKASDKSYRVRSIEMIPSILYKCISDQYKAYVATGHRIPMTLNQRCVLSKLIEEKTVEAYSTLNPVIEVGKVHTISTRGYKGSNSEYSYDEEKRSYDPSATGKLAMSTSPNANVGIDKQLTVEPTILNARGFRDQVEDPEELKDVNLFSPQELLTPGTIRNDDPIRSSIAIKQSGHVVPVADAVPSLVSNGYDEAVQFELSDDFVINAEEDGEVVDYNEDVGFVVVKYDSGKTKAINIKPEMVNNAGSGFYLSNQLSPVHTKIGEKFKKNEPLAYHNKYFKYSKLNGLRYCVGPLTKMAFMSSYNTYEDAGICTETLAERMKSSIVYQEVAKFKRNHSIISMVKVGDTVAIGDPLIKFNSAVEDDEIAKYLTKLSDQNKEILTEETKNEIKSSHAGKVIDIKVYTLLDPSNLSESLGKVVQNYFDQGNNKKKFLEKYDNSDSPVKAGYFLTDSTEPIHNKYNSIKGYKGIDVLIEIYIEHDDVAGVGDKIALYSANKQIISEVIPKGYEPYSEFRPDEEVSLLTSPGTVQRRMVSSVIPIAAAMKIMVELKRKIKDEIKFK